MSNGHDVAVVGRDEYRSAAAAISAGHAEYPSFRHLFPDPARRARALRAFFEATVRDAIPFGAVFATGEGGQVDATAVWLPPGAFPWSAWRKLRATPLLARVFLADPRAFPAFARYGGIVERHHRGNGASWYLEVLSVRPGSQRRGLGTRLLEPILERADRDGVPCRLETSDPANVAYYQRFGFDIDGPPLVVLRDGPTLTTMQRPAPRADTEKER
jgi:GNAT superfamily N-acetyltransferase